MQIKGKKKFIDASIIGDSHAMTLEKPLSKHIQFRHKMMATAKYFDGEFFRADDRHLSINTGNIKETYQNFDDENIATFVKARQKLDEKLQPVLTSNLPVISTLGAASYRFSRKIGAQILHHSGEVKTFSSKVIMAAAEEFAQYYIDFHKHLLRFVPRIIFIPGPTRFPDEQKPFWLNYDKMIIQNLTQIGIEMIDLRAQTSDDNLRMLPEYEHTDVLHANLKWATLLAHRIFDLIGYPDGIDRDFALTEG